MKLTKKSVRIIAAFLSSFTFFWIAYNLLADKLFGFVYIEILHWLGHSVIVMLLLAAFSVLLKDYKQPKGFFAHRIFGLFGVIYAVSHLFFFVLSYGFNVSQIWFAVSTQPYILFGDLALIALLVVQLTSGDKWRRNHHSLWRKFHYVYFVAVGGIIAHVILASKVVRPIFYFYIAVFIILTLFHIKGVRKLLLKSGND